MNDTPLPLIVCATSAFGASVALAELGERRREAPRGRGRRSCAPSSRTRAASSSRSPSATISSVGLSDWSSFRSTIDPELPSRSCAAACSASQFWPSCSSPSPTITTTRPPRPRWRFAQAMPRPFEMPIPSEPEFASMPGHADVRVAVEAAEPAQPQEPLARDHAEREQRRVEPGHVVALRREEDVPIGFVEADLRRRSAPRRAGATTMSSALKLEPRCPEPARFTATSAFSRHMSASSASRRPGSAPAHADPVELGLRDERAGSGMTTERS